MGKEYDALTNLLNPLLGLVYKDKMMYEVKINGEVRGTVTFEVKDKLSWVFYVIAMNDPKFTTGMEGHILEDDTRLDVIASYRDSLDGTNYIIKNKTIAIADSQESINIMSEYTKKLKEGVECSFTNKDAAIREFETGMINTRRKIF